MPRNPCPHCPSGFISRDLLERHIRFVHPNVSAQAPAPAFVTQLPSRSTGYLAMVLANPAPTAPPSVPAENRYTEEGQGSNGVAIATPETRPLLPEPAEYTGSTPSASLAVRPSRRGPVCFTVVYVAEAQNVSKTLHLPNTTPWPSFLNELAEASTSVAPRYIPGRSDGFWLHDGAWRFSLVDDRGVVEGRWRPLTRILFYQAMISELLKPDSPWRHAQVWHEAQSGETLRPQPRRLPSSSPPPTQPVTVPAEPTPQPATNSSVPINIIDGRTSFGRRSFLVQWLDGRPDSWIDEEYLEGHQALIDGYLRNLEGDRP